MVGLDCKEKFVIKCLLKNCCVESIRIYGYFVNIVCLFCICNKELLIESEYFSFFFVIVCFICMWYINFFGYFGCLLLMYCVFYKRFMFFIMR